MEDHRLIAVSVIGAFLLVVFGVLSHTGYEKFEVDQNFTEERVYASCHCFGGLSVMESYPPQYSCSGISYCRDVNYTRES